MVVCAEWMKMCSFGGAVFIASPPCSQAPAEIDCFWQVVESCRWYGLKKLTTTTYVQCVTQSTLK